MFMGKQILALFCNMLSLFSAPFPFIYEYGQLLKRTTFLVEAGAKTCLAVGLTEASLLLKYNRDIYGEADNKKPLCLSLKLFMDKLSNFLYLVCLFRLVAAKTVTTSSSVSCWVPGGRGSLLH
jgi:hypothetical protein